MHAPSPRPGPARSPLAALALALALAAAAPLGLAGCARVIGDPCSAHTDCSINADRRCDLTQTGGYCTIPACDPNRCPDDALCVEFHAESPRLARRFCMRACQTSGDCRAPEYECVTPTVGPTDACPAADGSAASCNRLLDTRVTNPPRRGYCVQRAQ